MSPPAERDDEEQDVDPEDQVELELDLNENFEGRIHVVGRPEHVTQVAGSVVAQIQRARFENMEHKEKAAFRRKFFNLAHIVVFSVAFLAIAGMAAHFLRVREFDTTFLFGMGAWTLGTVIYLYFVIIKDVFGLKTTIPRPPRS